MDQDEKRVAEVIADLRMDLDMEAVRAVFEQRGAAIWWLGRDWAEMSLTESPVMLDVYPHGSVGLHRLWIKFIPQAIEMLQAVYDEAMRQDAPETGES